MTPTTDVVPPTTVPASPGGGAEPGFVTSDDEVEVLIQGVDENEVPSAVNPEGRLVLTVGNFLKVRGRGFTSAGSAEVWLFSTPTLLGRVPKTASGDFAGRVRIPSGLEPGNHTVELRAKTRSGRSVLVSIPAIVIAGTRLEWETLPEDESGEASTNPIDESGESQDPGVQVAPGAQEITVPIGVVRRTVRAIAPRGVDLVGTRVEVRTPDTEWRDVDLASSEPVVLPIRAGVDEIEVRATTADGAVYTGSIPVSRDVEGGSRLALSLSLAALLTITAVVFFLIGRRRRKKDEEADNLVNDPAALRPQG